MSLKLPSSPRRLYDRLITMPSSYKAERISYHVDRIGVVDSSRVGIRRDYPDNL